MFAIKRHQKQVYSFYFFLYLKRNDKNGHDMTQICVATVAVCYTNTELKKKTNNLHGVSLDSSYDSKILLFTYLYTYFDKRVALIT